jgi:hypothetical protein
MFVSGMMDGEATSLTQSVCDMTDVSMGAESISQFWLEFILFQNLIRLSHLSVTIRFLEWVNWNCYWKSILPYQQVPPLGTKGIALMPRLVISGMSQETNFPIGRSGGKNKTRLMRCELNSRMIYGSSSIAYQGPYSRSRFTVDHHARQFRTRDHNDLVALPCDHKHGHSHRRSFSFDLAVISVERREEWIGIELTGRTQGS